MFFLIGILYAFRSNMQIFYDSTERFFFQSKPHVLMNKEKESTEIKIHNHSVKM